MCSKKITLTIILTDVQWNEGYKTVPVYLHHNFLPFLASIKRQTVPDSNLSIYPGKFCVRVYI